MQQAHAAKKAEKKNEKKMQALPTDVHSARDEIQKLQAELETKVLQPFVAPIGLLSSFAQKKELLTRENELAHREKELGAKLFKLEDLSKREKDLEEQLKKFKQDQDELRRRVESQTGSFPLPVCSAPFRWAYGFVIFPQRRHFKMLYK